MAITANDLKSYLESGATKIFSDGHDTLLYPFCHQGQMFQVWCDVMEDGGYARFYVPCLLNVAEAPARENVLLRLLDLNRRMKLPKFGYDPADGEVTVSVEIALEDGTLTEAQVHRCMFALTHLTMIERDNLLALMRTGVYPGSSDPEFTEMVSRLLGEDEGPRLAAKPV